MKAFHPGENTIHATQAIDAPFAQHDREFRHLGREGVSAIHITNPSAQSLLMQGGRDPVGESLGDILLKEEIHAGRDGDRELQLRRPIIHRRGGGADAGGTTAWSIGPEGGDQFAPSKASFMVNYRVEDLHALIAALKSEGCNVVDKVDDSEYGKFGWVIDPEGNKVELWQPPEGQ